MILTDELRGLIAKKGLSQARLAGLLGIVPETFYRKMEKGVFGSDEIAKMIQILSIENPAAIFFADEVTCHVTDHDSV